jgi:hypothetical protein
LRGGKIRREREQEPAGEQEGEQEEEMIEHAVSTPTIPIPFHQLLKVVALVNGDDPQVRPLLDRLAAEKYEIEISDRYDRDVSEDASVGAYIVAADGDRLEPARKLGQAVRALGFGTPLWAVADSHKISDMAVLGATARSTATSISASSRPRSTPSRSSRASSITA